MPSPTSIGITGPLSITEHDQSFGIKDRSGKTVCFVYFRRDAASANAAGVLEEPVARRFAEAILRLPELLTRELTAAARPPEGSSSPPAHSKDHGTDTP